jgi:hypothetical protein
MPDPMPLNPPVVRLCRAAEFAVTLDDSLDFTQFFEVDERRIGRLVLAFHLFSCLPQLTPDSDIEFIVDEIAVMEVCIYFYLHRGVGKHKNIEIRSEDKGNCRYPSHSQAEPGIPSIYVADEEAWVMGHGSCDHPGSTKESTNTAFHLAACR